MKLKSFLTGDIVDGASRVEVFIDEAGRWYKRAEGDERVDLVWRSEKTPSLPTVSLTNIDHWRPPEERPTSKGDL